MEVLIKQIYHNYYLTSNGLLGRDTGIVRSEDGSFTRYIEVCQMNSKGEYLITHQNGHFHYYSVEYLLWKFFDKKIPGLLPIEIECFRKEIFANKDAIFKMFNPDKK